MFTNQFLASFEVLSVQEVFKLKYTFHQLVCIHIIKGNLRHPILCAFFRNPCPLKRLVSVICVLCSWFLTPLQPAAITKSVLMSRCFLFTMFTQLQATPADHESAFDATLPLSKSTLTNLALQGEMLHLFTLEESPTYLRSPKLTSSMHPIEHVYSARAPQPRTIPSLSCWSIEVCVACSSCVPFFCSFIFLMLLNRFG